MLKPFNNLQRTDKMIVINKQSLHKVVPINPLIMTSLGEYYSNNLCNMMALDTACLVHTFSNIHASKIKGFHIFLKRAASLFFLKKEWKSSCHKNNFHEQNLPSLTKFI